MNFGLDSIDRANARARNAARLFAAALFVASVLLAFSARAAGNQLYDVTNLSLGGPTALVGGINPSGQVFGTASTPGYTALHAFVATRADGMVDLGTLGGNAAYAIASNASGQVVGYSKTSTAAEGYRTFLWTKAGGMVDIGTIGGKDYFPAAINDSGQVTGSFDASGIGLDYHGFSWTSAGGMVDTGTLGGSLTTPLAINASGQVVGWSRISNGSYTYHAFSWTRAGGIVDLGALPGGSNSSATGVNALGQVIGTSYFDDGTRHAFVWTQGGGMIDLGTDGATESLPYAILDSGQVFGYSYTPGSVYKAWMWTPATGVVDLSSLGGTYTVPMAVSASGQVVVGYSYLDSDLSQNHSHAFSWTSAGGMVDLGTFGGTYSMAQAINGLGQIVGGSALAGDASSHGFIHDGTSLKDLNTLLASKPAGLELVDAFLSSADGSIVANTTTGSVLLSPSSQTAAAPVIGQILADDPVAIGTSLSASASFTDANTGDTHSALWTWGDGGVAQPGTVTESGGSGTAKGSHTFAAAGIYSVSLAVIDSGGFTSNASGSVVVYDPSAGFVTGNGRIQSPAGAYKPDATVAGPATFSFVSKYQKGAKVPTGTTAFQFQSAALDFYSDAYDWMVVTGQARAQFKGSGTLNGEQNYKFMLTAIDGKAAGGVADRFRIKIWHYDATAQQDVTVYDNQLSSSTDGTLAEGTAVSAGNIVIHTPGK
jgi:probable HAF family extracellular repeat protein